MSVIIFFAILGILIYKDRKNIDFKFILIMRRTKRFRNLIDRIAKISPLFWKIVGTFAILICFFYMLQGTYILFIFQPQVQLVLPSLSSEVSVEEWYIGIPFWTWIIVIFSILVPHELSHGIIARAEKIKLKSVGLLLLVIFPGAFVEPDENEVKRSKIMTKLRIFAAGSFANFVVSFIIFYLSMYAIWPLSVNPGLLLLNVTPSGPAGMAGLRPNMMITEANGKPVTTTYIEYLNQTSYLFDEVGEIKPNQTVNIKADGKIYNVKVAFNETTNTTYMGVIFTPTFRVNKQILLPILWLLYMISLFSLAIGIVNILPIYPLDGGLMIEAITDEFAKRRSKQIVMTITFLVLLILVYSFVKAFL